MTGMSAALTSRRVGARHDVIVLLLSAEKQRNRREQRKRAEACGASAAATTAGGAGRAGAAGGDGCYRHWDGEFSRLAFTIFASGECYLMEVKAHSHRRLADRRSCQRDFAVGVRVRSDRSIVKCTAKLILYTQGVKVRQDIIVLGT